MELKYAKILQKIKLSSSYLYQKSHPSDDYQLEFSKFWIPFSEFQSLQISFPYFSFQPLISGLLFSKRKQPDKVKWFQSRFYCLYKDHLIVYSVKKKKKNQFIFFYFFRIRIFKNLKKYLY